MPPDDGCRFGDGHCVQDLRAQPIQPDKNQPFPRIEADPFGCFAAQNVQLMPERDILSLEPRSPPEAITEGGIYKYQDPNHQAGLWHDSLCCELE
jgi:hypothetical protein